MKLAGVLTVKEPVYDGAERMKASEELAKKIPELRLPRMKEEARAAFNAVLEYELPPGNSSTRDILKLADARGFAAHPADWIPYTKGDNQFSSLYQPTVDWLSEAGYTPYWQGNSLTRYSWDRFKPNSRRRAFKNLVYSDRSAVYDIMLNLSSQMPASIRLELLHEVEAGGSFYGNYPWQVPILEHFLTDRSAKVRALAKEKLSRMGDIVTEEDHAEELAKCFKIENGVASCSGFKDGPNLLNRHLSCTRFDLLAAALSIKPHDLVRIWNPKYFAILTSISADVETRTIIANRLLQENAGSADINKRFYKGLPRAHWERGLRLTFHSVYIFSFVDFLEQEIGTLDTLLMQETKCYQQMASSVDSEVKDGKLPVNKSWDPLRILGLGVNKQAAAEVLNQALDLGMDQNNPRLSMLKLNLAL